MTFADALVPVEGWIADGVIRRAAAVVLHDGVVVAERYWGDAADGHPIDAGTLLPFASLTKPVVATAVLRLVERGTLSLAVALGDVLPDAPAPWGRITVAQLLTHTAGFPEFVPGAVELEARLAPASDYVRAALGAAPAFPAGTRVLYSNPGFQVLGAMVERTVRADIAEVLEREAIGPLGLARATMRPLARPGARTARTELGARGGDPRSEIYNSAYFKRLARADAGLFAAPRDIARLLETYRLDGAGALRPETARDAVTSHTAGLPGRYGAYEWPSCDFGWSWEIRDGKSPHPTGARTSPRTFGHLGGSGALAFCDPDRALSVVIHTLRDFGDGWATRRPYLTRLAGALVDAADSARPRGA